VPVWHAATTPWVRDGRLVVLGVIQEQHPDRGRLFAQWKGFDWPILHDPINVLGLSGVPELVAIDEHGIVRDTGPRRERFETGFLKKRFPDDAVRSATKRVTPAVPAGGPRPDLEALRARARKEGSAAAWRELGDALALWGGGAELSAAIEAYAQALRREPHDGPTLFRLGVCYRQRCESSARRSGDFQAAIDAWEDALARDPNQYIWRRRIQQYGPRLDKPYSFYDWVAEAEKAIRGRGDKPVPLVVRPGGAEIAYPERAFGASAGSPRNPDPEGKLRRDRDGSVRAEATVVPGRARPGRTARIHIVLRLDPKAKAHWDNEADPLRLWVDPPEGWQITDRLIAAPSGTGALSDEERTLEFELKVPRTAHGKVRIPAYALYHVCDDRHGQCRLLRLDVPIAVTVGE
jgi:hypothetical protein